MKFFTYLCALLFMASCTSSTQNKALVFSGICSGIYDFADRDPSYGSRFGKLY